MDRFIIVRCEELVDQYECDANRIIEKYTEDKNELRLYGLGYEWYEIKEDNSIILIKDADEGIEDGMIFGYWIESYGDEIFTIIQKYKTLNRESKIPKPVRQKMKNLDEDEYKDMARWIKQTGEFSLVDDDNKRYVYGEYTDDHYPLGY